MEVGREMVLNVPTHDTKHTVALVTIKGMMAAIPR